MEGAPCLNLIKAPKAKPTKIVVNFWRPAGSSRSSLHRRSPCFSLRRCTVRQSPTPVGAEPDLAEATALTKAMDGAATRAAVAQAGAVAKAGAVARAGAAIRVPEYYH